MSSAILYENLVDSGIVTASSWIASAPPSTLQNKHVTRRWQGSNTASEYIVVNWSESQTIDTIGLFGAACIVQGTLIPFPDTGTIRIRVSSFDNTGLTGDLYDSGDIVGLISSKYSSLINLQSTPLVGAKTVRIDISEATAEAILAGRFVVGLRNTFTVNFDFNWTYGYMDLSRIRKSAGGLTFVDRDDKYRVLNLTYASLDPTDRYGFIQELDRINGMSDDVLFIIDSNSSELSRDSLWGLLQDMSPPSQPNFAYFQKVFKIEERR